jgi:hypothetical protein
MGSIRTGHYRDDLLGSAGPYFKPICMKNAIYTDTAGNGTMVPNIYIGDPHKLLLGISHVKYIHQGFPI